MTQISLDCIGSIFKTENGYICYSANGVVLPKELLQKAVNSAPNDYTEAEFFEAVDAEYAKEAGR